MSDLEPEYDPTDPFAQPEGVIPSDDDFVDSRPSIEYLEEQSVRFQYDCLQLATQTLLTDTSWLMTDTELKKQTQQIQSEYFRKMMVVNQTIYHHPLSGVHINVNGIRTDGAITKYSTLEVNKLDRKKASLQERKYKESLLPKIQNGQYLPLTQTPITPRFQRGNVPICSITLKGKMEHHTFLGVESSRLHTLSMSSKMFVIADLLSSPDYNHTFKALLHYSFRFVVKAVQHRFTSNSVRKVERWVSGNLKRNRVSPVVIKSNGIVASILWALVYACDYECLDDAIQLSKFISTFTQRHESTDDGSKVAFSTADSSFFKLDDYAKSLFKHVVLEVDWRGHRKMGYIMDFNFDGIMLLGLEIAELSMTNKKPSKRVQTFSVKKSEALKMSVLGKNIILRNMVAIVDDVIYVGLHTKQEYGNLGRQYNSLEQLPSIDRDCIENLKGYDMESAMQMIFLWLFQDELGEDSFTHYYVNHKQAVRDEVEEITGLSPRRVKQGLQAVYMGSESNNRNKIWKALGSEDYRGCFEERNKIFDLLSKRTRDNTLASQYARKRVKDKLGKENVNLSNMSFKAKKSFAFFYWSFYERKVQDVMCEHFENPLPLHDAVYTQSDTLPDKEVLEDEIETITGISMKLGVA